MRSVLLILATVGIIGGGFFVYWLLQPAAPQEAATPTRPRIASVASTQPDSGASASSSASSATRPSIIGGAEGAWVKRFDPNTSALVSQFRGAEFTPSDDGTLVTRPEAEFFLTNGQYLRMVGERGVVVMSSPVTSQEDLRSIQGNSPSRGELTNVTIELFKTLQARRPLLTVELPNVAFDNDTFRIQTQAYEQDGQTIPADQVPVTVRGADYDFDGRGLTIRWNERNQRLEFLEIAHGERLVIKNSEAFGATSRGDEFTAETQRAQRENRDHNSVAVSAISAPPRLNFSSPAMFAATDETAVAEELAGAIEDLYRATFFDDIRIEQGGKPLVKAAAMHVDFMLDQRDDDAEATATQPTTQRARAERSATTRASKPRQANEPITVRWAGKLRVTPAEQRPERRIPPGEALVTIEGADAGVVLDQDGRHIDCARALYETADQTFHVLASDRFPVRMTDPKGTKITTLEMSYSLRRSVASLRGKSRAELPIEIDGKPSTMVAEWNESCRLELADADADDAIAIRDATLRGEVSVTHPQLDMRSAELSLKFKEPAPEPQGAAAQFDLDRLTAVGGVDCRLRGDEGEADQRIECDRLVLVTETDEAGRLFPRRIDADGNVRTADAERELRAGMLSATISPSTDKPGEFEIERFEAQTDVRMTALADGASAEADQIIADARQIKLIGQPARFATADQSVSGPIIQIEPDAQRIGVLGEGTLRFVQDAPDRAAAGRPQPIDVSWTRSVALEGKSNQVDIDGSVRITTTDEKFGTLNATAERLTLTLKHKAAADDEPAEAGTDGANVGDALAARFDFLKDKEVSSVTLVNNVQVESTLLADDGSLEKRLALLAPTLTYSLADSGLHVPAPGRMLYQDYSVDDSDTASSATPAPAGTTARGDTAFAWQREMRYVEASRQATMSGGVMIVHRPADKMDRFQLEADEVVAELTPAATSSSPSGADFDITRLIARGHLLFTAEGIEMIAQTIEYDPDTHWLIGRGGSEYDPATFTKGVQTLSAEEVQINTETWHFRSTNPTGTVGQ